MGKRTNWLLAGSILVLLAMYPTVLLAEDMEAVVSPIGRTTITPKPVGASIPDLNGKTVCELWNHVFQGDRTFPVLESLLTKKYPTVKFVSYTEFGYVYGPDELKVIEALPGNLKKFKCDAVIAGNGG